MTTSYSGYVLQEKNSYPNVHNGGLDYNRYSFLSWSKKSGHRFFKLPFVVRNTGVRRLLEYHYVQDVQVRCVIESVPRYFYAMETAGHAMSVISTI
jgi:hypothetical protein